VPNCLLLCPPFFLFTFPSSSCWVSSDLSLFAYLIRLCPPHVFSSFFFFFFFFYSFESVQVFPPPPPVLRLSPPPFPPFLGFSSMIAFKRFLESPSNALLFCLRSRLLQYSFLRSRAFFRVTRATSRLPVRSRSLKGAALSLLTFLPCRR